MHTDNTHTGNHAEQRLCYNLLGPSGPSSTDHLGESAKILKSGSKFEARMLEKARGLPKLPGEDREINIADFSEDGKWREIFLETSIFSVAKNITYIDSIEAFLDNLEPDDRKKILIEYLKDRFPETAVVGDADFDTIDATDPANLHTDPDALQAIKTFMILGKAIHNEEVTNADVTASSFVDRDDLDSYVDTELKARYTNAGRNLTPAAFNDFDRIMRENPAISPSVSKVPADLALALSEVKSPFAAAVRISTDPARAIFTSVQLEAMTDKLEEKRKEEQEAATHAIKMREPLLNLMEKQRSKGITKQILENYRNASPGAKLVTLVVGGAIAWFIYKKTNNATKFALLALPAFYLSGARDMLKNTPIDGILRIPEEGIRRGMEALTSGSQNLADRIGGLPTNPDLAEEELQTYAYFINEIATEDVKSEIEAMAYISEVPVGVIASSFDLKNGAREGELRLERGSGIYDAIDTLYKRTGQSRKVLGVLSSYRATLGDSMAHLFYMLGASERPVDHQKIETVRGSGAYDDIPDGTPERDLYRTLTERGMSLARSKYSGQNWYQVVAAMVNA